MHLHGTSLSRRDVLQGDSGFALFRNKELIFQSSPLQHFFDCPYQFASCPDFTNDTDQPEDAADYELQLQSGDVIVAATDGLWDNIHTQELLPLLPTSEDAVQQVRCPTTPCAPWSGPRPAPPPPPPGPPPPPPPPSLA